MQVRLLLGTRHGNAAVQGAEIQRYLGRISGPLLDRIDLHMRFRQSRGRSCDRTSAALRRLLCTAAAIPHGELRRLAALDEASERTLEKAMRRMSLSARAHDRILKVARTIADLGGAEAVAAKHIAEAVQYRSLDRGYWT